MGRCLSGVDTSVGGVEQAFRVRSNDKPIHAAAVHRRYAADMSVCSLAFALHFNVHVFLTCYLYMSRIAGLSGPTTTVFFKCVYTIE